MPPNILQIIVHDLGRELPCYGREAIRAPALSKLAETGVVFTQHYACSTPCSPARGCLMAGRYAHESGLVGLAHKGWNYNEGERTVAHELAGAGYRTLLFGYQHERQGDPRALGYADAWTESRDAHAVAERAEAFFRSEAAGAAPFYLNCGFFEVHWSWDDPKYGMAPPASVEVPGYLPDAPPVREDLARFYGCIRYMDAAVGRILDALEASPVAPNTLVVFTTDHGIAFPRAKGTLYDPGVGTAMIARLPGGAAGLRVDALVESVDFAPTLLELAGVPAPDGMLGASFLPALRGEAFEGKDVVFFEKNYHDWYDPIRAVRTHRYKLVRSFRDRMANAPLSADLARSRAARALRPDALAVRPTEELYDLESDAGEEENRINDPTLTQVREDLRARLGRWMRETGDFLLGGEVPPPPMEKQALDPPPGVAARNGG